SRSRARPPTWKKPAHASRRGAGPAKLTDLVAATSPYGRVARALPVEALLQRVSAVRAAVKPAPVGGPVGLLLHSLARERFVLERGRIHGAHFRLTPARARTRCHGPVVPAAAPGKPRPFLSADRSDRRRCLRPAVVSVRLRERAASPIHHYVAARSDHPHAA